MANVTGFDVAKAAKNFAGMYGQMRKERDEVARRAERAEAAARDLAKALGEAADGWPRPNRYDEVLARHPEFSEGTSE